MTTPLSAAQLERLRRDAKKLARKKSIPLFEAQQELAAQRGYANWSQLVKASKATTLMRGAFTTLFVRRYGNDQLLGALSSQLGHLNRRITDIYRRGDAKGPAGKSRDPGCSASASAAPGGQVGNAEAEASATPVDYMPSPACLQDEIAQMLGHQLSDVTQRYLRLTRAKRGVP